MEQKEVELLIDKKIAEAKLKVARRTISFLLWFFGILLTIVGVAIPLIQTNRSSDKADEAIRDMKKETKEIQTQYETKSAENEKNFKETVKEINSQQNSALTIITNSADKKLTEVKEQTQAIIGQQLAKPELTCRFNGEEINGKTINVTNVNNWNTMFEIFNKGKATARNIKLVLYIKENSKLGVQIETPWKPREVSEEKGFVHSFNYEGYQSKLDIVDPQYPAQLEAGFYFNEDVKEAKEELLLKIYYGQPEPTKVNFVIEKKK